MKMAGALVLSVFCHEDPGAVSTVPSGEGFVSRLTDGSGIDTCLPSRRISDKKLVYKESISSTNDLRL
jgi:hypothetical protein